MKSDPKKLSFFPYSNGKSCSIKTESKSTMQQQQSIQISSKRDDLYYNMGHEYQGRCIILNYESFDSEELSRRRGTESDVRKLLQTFKQLNFVVQMYNDLTQQKTFDIFRQGKFFFLKMNVNI